MLSPSVSRRLHDLVRSRRQTKAGVDRVQPGAKQGHGGRHLKARVGDGSLDTFACGSNLFFQGQAYDVKRTVSTEAPLRFEVSLTPRETPLGEVRFTGLHLQRALLTEGPWTVVLEVPAPAGVGDHGVEHLRVGLENGLGDPGHDTRPVLPHQGQHVPFSQDSPRRALGFVPHGTSKWVVGEIGSPTHDGARSR